MLQSDIFYKNSVKTRSSLKVLEKLHEEFEIYQVIKDCGWVWIGQKWLADSGAHWECRGLEESGEIDMLFHWIWGFSLQKTISDGGYPS